MRKERENGFPSALPPTLHKSLQRRVFLRLDVPILVVKRALFLTPAYHPYFMNQNRGVVYHPRQGRRVSAKHEYILL